MKTSNSSMARKGHEVNSPSASAKQTVVKERSPPESCRRSLTLVRAAAAAAVCFTARATPRSSVAFAVQGLLAGLQATFPATVHNVVRTARKLRAPSAAVCTDDVGLCAFCFALLPPRAVVTALAAAAVSDAGGDAVELCTRCLRLARVLPSLVAP